MILILITIGTLTATPLRLPEIDESIGKSIIGVLYPEFDMKMSDANPNSPMIHGTITPDQGNEVKFDLAPLPSMLTTSSSWSAYLFTRREAGWTQSDLETYLGGGAAPKASAIKDTLIIIPTNETGPARRYVPDGDAIGNDIFQVRIDDFIGDGSLQAWLETEALYITDHPREFVGPGVYRLLRLPELTELFSAVGHKIVIGPSLDRTFEVAPRTFRFVSPKSGEFNDIVQISHEGIEEDRFEYDGTSYRHFVQHPNARDESGIQRRQEKRRLAMEGERLSIIVVNESGNPIAGAKVTGNWNSSRGLSGGQNRIGRIDGTTNASGEFTQTTPSAIAVKVSATGYYPVSRAWAPGQIPSEPVVITLEEAEQAIPMFEWERAATWWKDPRDQFQFGVTIASTSPAKTNVIEDRTESDLWFEISTQQAFEQPERTIKTDDVPANVRRDWRISVYALNGWEIAPGPAAPTRTTDDPNMRVAPDSGYAKELHFDSTQNLALFLHHGDSDRYGKAYKLVFSDHSFPGIASYGFHVIGLIQEESSGSRSLNPMSYEERHGLIPTEQTPSNPSTATHDAVRSDYAAVEAESTLEDSPGATPTTDVDLEQQPSQKLAQTALESSEEILNKAPRPRVATYIAVGGVAIIVLFSIILTYRLKRG